MIFSELKSICDATGLSYNEETGILAGIKHGIEVAVFDNKAQRRFDIICGATVRDEQINKIIALTDSFPKKTLLGAENADGCVKVYCKAYNLMQENLPLLINFLEKLTDFVSRHKRTVTSLTVEDIERLGSFAVIRKGTPANDKKKQSDKPAIDHRATVKGILGGLLGALLGSSLFIVFIMMSDMLSWIGAVVMAAAVISLYTVFSHRLKAVDVSITAVLVLVGWFFSNTFSLLFRIFLRQQEAGESLNLFVIMDNFSHYITKHSELAGLYMNSLIVTFVFVVAGAVGSYFFYYKHNQKDMY